MPRKKNEELTQDSPDILDVTENSETSEIRDEGGEIVESSLTPSDKTPAVIPLSQPSVTEALAPATSKESIEAAIKEKLSKRTDRETSDPFVPEVQLEKEVEDIAKKKGFPLSRGTEIGARLMARSKRV
jgi:hypothetical protein